MPRAALRSAGSGARLRTARRPPVGGVAGHNGGVVVLRPVAGTTQPTGAGFDLVLLFHVACAVVALGSVAACGIQAARLLAQRPGEALAASVVRYFSPGVNWAGRALYGVPVLGLALVAMSGGFYRVADSWIVGSLVLWAAAAVVGESLLWPAERKVQELIASVSTADATGDTDAGRTEVRAPQAAPALAAAPAASTGDQAFLRTQCRTLVWSSAAVTSLLMVALGLMVAQP